jgi:VWFA-related protein
MASRPALALHSALLVALLLPMVPAAAQVGGAASPPTQPPMQPPATAAAAGTEGAVFFESLDVNVVNVDVYVTDRDDKPVTGLTADDFELSEDGRPIRVSNFYAVEGGRPTTPPAAELPSRAAAAPPHPSPPPPPGLPPEPTPVPADQKLHLILYFDNLQLRPFDRNKVARLVRSFLADQVRPDDQVMLVTFERSLHVRQPFTSDLRAVYDALTGIEKLTGYAEQAGSERDQIIRRMDSTKELDVVEQDIDFYAKSVHQDVHDSIRALEDLIGSLGGLPGRKALVYVSDGLAMTAGDDVFHFLDLRFGSLSQGKLMAMRYDSRNEFRELVAHANANRVTFYTLDAEGLSPRSSLSAERGGNSDGASFAELDFVHESNLSEPLQLLAADTGGLATFNTNNLAGALHRMAEDFGSYYSLGYVPAHSGDGRYHTIDVKVKRKGVQVRHRAGYRDKTMEARLAEGAMAALLHGVENDPLQLEVVLGEGRPRGDGYYLVPLQVGIPLGKLTLVPQGGFYRGQIRVVVSVVDRSGSTSPPEQTTIPLEVPAADIETARSKNFVYSVDLLTRAGDQEVAIGVRDELAGETDFVRRGFTVR